MHPRNAFVTFALLAGLQMAQAQNSGYWSAGTGGSWANAGNWDGGTIADGTDNTAYFGFSIEPPIPANATFTLNGARTIGDLTFTAQTTPATWYLNTGTGGPLTLDTTFNLPAVTVTPAGLQLTVNTVIAGTEGLEKFGAGKLILTATNTYTGGTTVSDAGILLVNGVLLDTNDVTVTSGTLGGTGMISGPVTVQNGATFSPGGSPGVFTISNSLTLQAGSKTVVEVNASTLAHDSVVGISTVNYGGTLIVSNLAGTPTLGQSFTLFSATNSTGDFAGITPQLTGGLRWKFSAVNGSLSVISTNSQPKFAAFTLIGQTNLLFSVTNGLPGSTNYLIASTNLLLPRANWTRLATNIFDAGGNSVFASTKTGDALRCYSISVLP